VPHLLVVRGVQIDSAEMPSRVVLAALVTGDMAVFHYLPTEKINAWTRWHTDLGTIESVCVLPGVLRDDIFIVAKSPNNTTRTLYQYDYAADDDAGLPIAARLRTVKLDSVFADGATVGRIRRVNDATIRLKDTPQEAQLSIERPDGSLMPLRLWPANVVSGAEQRPFTGDIPVSITGGYTRDGGLTLVSSAPYPATILSITPRVDYTSQ
jgi:hypothetical protein